MAKINDVINWVVSSGALVVLILFLYAYLRPLINHHITAAKTASERQKWALLEQVADTAVTALVGRDDLAGHDKFKLAKDQAIASLEKAGVKMSDSAVNMAVQAAYEASPLTPTVDPKAEQKEKVLNGVKDAPNRANQVNTEVKEGLQ